MLQAWKSTWKRHVEDFAEAGVGALSVVRGESLKVGLQRDLLGWRGAPGRGVGMTFLWLFNVLFEGFLERKWGKLTLWASVSSYFKTIKRDLKLGPVSYDSYVCPESARPCRRTRP